MKQDIQMKGVIDAKNDDEVEINLKKLAMKKQLWRQNQM